jgi:hypothetical protein
MPRPVFFIPDKTVTGGILLLFDNQSILFLGRVHTSERYMIDDERTVACKQPREFQKGWCGTFLTSNLSAAVTCQHGLLLEKGINQVRGRRRTIQTW